MIVKAVKMGLKDFKMVVSIKEAISKENLQE